jgi:hypothetical protein
MISRDGGRRTVGARESGMVVGQHMLFGLAERQHVGRPASKQHNGGTALMITPPTPLSHDRGTRLELYSTNVRHLGGWAEGDRNGLKSWHCFEDLVQLIQKTPERRAGDGERGRGKTKKK